MRRVVAVADGGGACSQGGGCSGTGGGGLAWSRQMQQPEQDQEGGGGHGDREHGEDGRVGAVGPGGQQVRGCGHQQREGSQVDASPEPVGQAAAGQRGGLDRDQQVDGHHPPGDRPGPPGGCQRDQQVQQVELDVGVRQQGGEVDAGEGQRQPAEVAVQVQGPSGCGPAAQQAGGDGQTPKDGGGQQAVGDQPAGPGS